MERFIVGTGRCGSTLLSRMLGERPEVCSLFELLNGLDVARRFQREPIRGPDFAALVTAEQPFLTAVLRRGYPVEEVVYPFGRGRYRRGEPMPYVAGACLPRLSGDPDALLDALCARRGLPPAPAAAQHRLLFAWLAERSGRPRWIERSGSSVEYLAGSGGAVPRRALPAPPPRRPRDRALDARAPRLPAPDLAPLPRGGRGRERSATRADRLRRRARADDAISRILASRPRTRVATRWCRSRCCRRNSRPTPPAKPGSSATARTIFVAEASADLRGRVGCRARGAVNRLRGHRVRGGRRRWPRAWSQGPLDLSRGVEGARCVADSLDKAHRQGCDPRRPEARTIVGPDGGRGPKLLDFGRRDGKRRSRSSSGCRWRPRRPRSRRSRGRCSLLCGGPYIGTDECTRAGRGRCPHRHLRVRRHSLPDGDGERPAFRGRRRRRWLVRRHSDGRSPRPASKPSLGTPPALDLRPDALPGQGSEATIPDCLRCPDGSCSGSRPTSVHVASYRFKEPRGGRRAALYGLPLGVMSIAGLALAPSTLARFQPPPEPRRSAVHGLQPSRGHDTGHSLARRPVGNGRGAERRGPLWRCPSMR